MNPRPVVAALLTAFGLGSAQAVTLLSENFATATAGLYGPNPIPGTAFSVTNGNVDLIGLPGGSPFSCVRLLTANCLDLVGNQGSGAIASTAGFNLVAGSTYTVSFGGLLQGFAPGGGQTTDFTVSLGSLSSTQTADTNGSLYSINFTPLTSQAGATLAFSSLTAPDSVHGVVLDSIVLSVTAVPEPQGWALMIAGLAGLGCVARRGKGATLAEPSGAQP